MRECDEVDVVVVGAGLAGLSAANRVAEGGASVLVLEKGDDENYMCNSRIAGGVFNLAHSDPMSGATHLRDAILGDTEGYADPSLTQAVAGAAGEAMDWLRSEGAKFIRVQRPNSTARWSMAPPRPPIAASHLIRSTWEGRGPDYVVRSLGRQLTKRGGRIVFRTRARKLIIDNSGCAGVLATADKTNIEIRAKYVVIADGGFQANLDLVRRFIGPRPELFTQRNARTGMGDGLLMAEEAGAYIKDCHRFYGHLLVRESATNDELWPYPTLDTLSTNAIVVDRSGKRFIDEGVGGIPILNALASMDDPLCATTVFDNAIWEKIGKLEHTPPNPLLVTHGGTVHRADSLERLAEKIGVPTTQFVATVDDYNKAIKSGTLASLTPHRTPGRMYATLRSSEQRMAVAPIETAPFYGVPLRPGITYTMGGIAVDANAQVLTPLGEPIAGLYAAGTCTAGLEGGPASGYIGGLSKALILGFIAARSILAEEAS